MPSRGRATSQGDALDSELIDRKSLDTLVKKMRRNFTAAVGVGAVVAATVLIAWSHAGRVRSTGCVRLTRRDLPGPGFIR